MNAIQLFFACLIVTTARADSVQPLAFFAKVKNTLMPLSGTLFTEFDDMKVFSYGDPSAAPVEFTLTQNNYAYASNGDVIGFVNSLFVFGSTVDPTPLQFDSGNRLKNGRFYSCQVSTDSDVHRIFYEIKDPYHEYCFEMNIYLLPHKKPSEISQVTKPGPGNSVEKDFGQDVEKDDDMPWAFFENRNDKFMPFSSNAPREFNTGMSAFSLGESSEADEFFSQNGDYFSPDRSSDESMRIHDDPFSMRPAMHHTKLKHNDQRRVHSIYQSCSSVHGMNFITDHKSPAHCSKEEIDYYYERKTESSMNSQIEGDISFSEPPNGPYVLFAKIGDSLVALGSRTYFDDGFQYSSMCYGINAGNPVEFFLVDNSATSTGTSHNGFVGIYYHTLTFGPNIPATDLMLDANGKLRNADYFSCFGIGGVRIINSFRTSSSCFEVDIYLLPYNTEAVNSLVKHLPENENASEEKSKLGSGKKVFGKGEDKVSSEKTDLSPPYASKNLPFYFFAQFDGFMTPLGARIVLYNGNYYGLLTYGDTISPPIEFNIVGNAAHSDKTSIDGFAGIFEGTLVFGPEVPLTNLMLDENMRLRNSLYFSCWNVGDVQIIYTDNLHPKCFEVDIYLLHNAEEAKAKIDPTALPNKNESENERKNVFKEDGLTSGQNKKNKPSNVSRKPPYVFYAKIGDTMQPLGARIYSRDGVDYSRLCYGRDIDNPIEFEMIGDFARSKDTSNDGYAGIFRSMLTFGPHVPAINLMLDENRRVRNAQYFSCSLFQNIQLITTTRFFPYCFEVEIYLLNEGTETVDLPSEKKNVAEKGRKNKEDEGKVFWKGRKTEKDEGEVFWKASLGEDKVSLKKPESNNPTITENLPFVLFANFSGNSKRLGARVYSHHGLNYSAMGYGHRVSDVAEFKMEGIYVVSQNTSNDGYLGLYDETLVYGPTIRRTDLMLDSEGKLTNADYYSCGMSEGVSLITTSRFFSHCFSVDVYLLPDKKEAANAMVGKPSPKKESLPEKENLPKKESLPEKGSKNSFKQDKVSSEQQEKQTSLLMDPPKLTYMFFAILNEAIKPLSARVIPLYGTNFSVMYYENGADEPAKFTKEGNYALSFNTSLDGYFGLYNNLVVFGPSISPVKLSLGADGKVINTNYYSCLDNYNNEMISIERINDYCDDVDIFFLHYNPDTGKPVFGESESSFESENKVLEEEKNNLSEERRKPESFEEKKISLEVNKGSSEKTESSPSSVAIDSPYVFFVKFNDQKIPLSADIIPYFGTDISVMFYESGPAKPVEFNLVEGYYAKSIGTPTDGYFGLVEKLFAFGSNIPRSKLELDANRKLINADFYSCWSNPVDANVISTEKINDYCFEVEIYFQHLDPTSGKPVPNMP